MAKRVTDFLLNSQRKLVSDDYIRSKYKFDKEKAPDYVIKPMENLPEITVKKPKPTDFLTTSNEKLGFTENYLKDYANQIKEQNAKNRQLYTEQMQGTLEKFNESLIGNEQRKEQRKIESFGGVALDNTEKAIEQMRTDKFTTPQFTLPEYERFKERGTEQYQAKFNFYKDLGMDDKKSKYMANLSSGIKSEPPKSMGTIESYDAKYKQEHPDIAFQIGEQETKEKLKSIWYGLGTGVGSGATDIFVNAPYRALADLRFDLGLTEKSGKPIANADPNEAVRKYLGYGPGKGSEAVKTGQSARALGTTAIDLGLMIGAGNPIAGGFLVGALSSYGKGYTVNESLKNGASMGLFMLAGGTASKLVGSKASQLLASKGLGNTIVGKAIEKIASGTAFGTGGTLSQELTKNWTGHDPTPEEWLHNIALGVVFEAIPTTVLSVINKSNVRAELKNQANVYHNEMLARYNKIPQARNVDEVIALYDDMIDISQRWKKMLKDKEFVGAKEQVQYMDDFFNSTIDLMRKQRGLAVQFWKPKGEPTTRKYGEPFKTESTQTTPTQGQIPKTATYKTGESTPIEPITPPLKQFIEPTKTKPIEPIEQQKLPPRSEPINDIPTTEPINDIPTTEPKEFKNELVENVATNEFKKVRFKKATYEIKDEKGSVIKKVDGSVYKGLGLSGSTITHLDSGLGLITLNNSSEAKLYAQVFADSFNTTLPKEEFVELITKPEGIEFRNNLREWVFDNTKTKSTSKMNLERGLENVEREIMSPAEFVEKAIVQTPTVKVSGFDTYQREQILNELAKGITNKESKIDIKVEDDGELSIYNNPKNVAEVLNLLKIKMPQQFSDVPTVKKGKDFQEQVKTKTLQEIINIQDTKSFSNYMKTSGRKLGEIFKELDLADDMDIKIDKLMDEFYRSAPKLLKKDKKLNDYLARDLESNFIRRMKSEHMIDRANAKKIYKKMKSSDKKSSNKKYSNKKYSDSTVKNEDLKFSGPEFAGRDYPESTGEGDLKKALKPQEIMDKIARKFEEAYIRKGRLPRNVSGRFHHHDFLIKLKKSNDIPTLIHELAHYLDVSNKLVDGLSELDQNRLSQKFTDTQNDKMKLIVKARESFAELIRSYVVGEIGPEHDYFSEFAMKLLKTKDLLFIGELRDDIMNVINLNSVDSVKNTIHEESKIDKNILTAKERLEQLYIKMADENFYLSKVGLELGGERGRDRIEGRIAQFRGFQSIAEYNINAKGLKGHFQTNVEGKNIGPSLGDIIRKVMVNKEKEEDFKAYLVSLRAKDYKNKGLDMPLPHLTYTKALEKLNSKYPEFKEIAKSLRKYTANLLQMFVDVGIRKQHEVDKIIIDNPNHIYLFRVLKPNGRTGMSKAIGKIDNPIKKVVGSGLDIIDPIESVIKMTYLYWNIATKQQILSELAKMERQARGKGSFIHVADEKYKPINLNSKRVTDVVKTYISQIFPALGMEEAEVIELMDAIDQTSEFEFLKQVLFEISYKAKTNQLVIHENGKPRLYNVHPLLYDTLMLSPRSVGNIFTKASIKIADFQAKTIMLNPTFIARLGLREIGSDLIFTRTGITPLDVMKAYINVLGGNAIWKEYEKRGGVNSVYFGKDGVFENEVMQQLRDSVNNFKKFKHKTLNPTETIMESLTVTDVAPKLAEFTKDLENQGILKQGLFSAIQEAIQNKTKNISKKFIEMQSYLNDVPAEFFRQAIFKARDISLDVSKKGKTSRELQLNRHFRFFDSTIAGNFTPFRKLLVKRKASKSHKTWKNIVGLNWFEDNRFNALLRGSLYGGLTALVLYSLNRNNENYKNTENWKKDAYFMIPIGDPDTTELYYFYPKSFQDHLLFATIPERIMRSFDEDEYESKRAWDGLMDTVKGMVFPSGTPIWVSPFMEAWTNSEWNGLPIENMGDKNLLPVDRYDERTSLVARQIAHMVKDMTWLPEEYRSPKMIDNFIIGYTNRVGTTILTTIDVALGEKPSKDLLTATGILNLGVQDASKYSKAINEFYEDWELARNTLNSMKKNDKEWNNSDEAKNRVLLIAMNKIYTKGKEIMDILEEARQKAIDEGKPEIAENLRKKRNELAKKINKIEDVLYSD